MNIYKLGDILEDGYYWLQYFDGVWEIEKVHDNKVIKQIPWDELGYTQAVGPITEPDILYAQP